MFRRDMLELLKVGYNDVLVSDLVITFFWLSTLDCLLSCDFSICLINEILDSIFVEGVFILIQSFFSFSLELRFEPGSTSWDVSSTIFDKPWKSLLIASDISFKLDSVVNAFWKDWLSRSTIRELFPRGNDLRKIMASVALVATPVKNS